MKAKTSITLSMAVLTKLDRAIGEGASRSAFIEKVLSEKLSQMERDAINLRDMELINAAADRLNAEAKDVLEDQDTWYFDSLKDNATVTDQFLAPVEASTK
jgi:metal-responsive CopG/Arc/MetJ family transcriptional regulator